MKADWNTGEYNISVKIKTTNINSIDEGNIGTCEITCFYNYNYDALVYSTYVGISDSKI